MTTSLRDLIKILSALPLAAAMGKQVKAAACFFSRSEPLRLNRFSVAGFEYYQGRAVMHRLKPGTRLKLAREPDNPHDPFAVEIYRGRKKIGYVPRSDNKYICRMLEQGVRLKCRVVDVDSEAVVWSKVKVEVWIV